MKKHRPIKTIKRLCTGSGKESQSSRRHKLKRTQTQSTDSRTSCTCGNENLLPWWFPWMVVIVTMVVRVNYVQQPNNWWILHPDEVFQSVEVAFSEVYGYGFRPYEYLPPIRNATTPAEQQQTRSGAYSLRSFLLPRAFAVVLSGTRYIGVQQNPFLVCRIFHAAVSSTLPMAVFLFVRKLFTCRLLASMTCAMTASSLHLAVFGTHTLVNSFIAPFLFLGLTFCLPEQSRNLNQTAPVDTSKPVSDTHKGMSLRQNGHMYTYKQFESWKQTSQDQNGNLVPRDDDDGRTSSEESISSNNSSLQEDNFFPRISSASDKSESADDCVAIMNCNDTSDHFANRIQTMVPTMKLVCGGFLVGICCYIRVDSSLFFVLVFIPIVIVRDADWSVKIIGMIWSSLGGTFGLLLGGLEDYSRYGTWFLSPMQWTNFNVFNKRASLLYANNIHGNYFDTLFSNYITKTTTVAILVVIVYSLVRKKEIFHKYNLFSILLSCIILCVIYSLVGHSQPRFFHNIYVLQSILYSYGFHHVLHLIAGKGNSYDKSGRSIIILPLVLTTLSCFAATAYNNFPTASDDSASNWSYRNAAESRDLNICLDFIRTRTDVRGVVIDSSLYTSGGYSILNHDVPILTKIHKEYHLYKSRSDTRLGKNSKIRLITNFSDYVHTSNQHYFQHLLGRSDTLNYAVTSSGQRTFYENMKYTNIFSTGNLLVFERNLSQRDEERLNKLSSEIPVGNNATILEYESNWLITNGLYQLATVRGERALELHTDRIRTFQQLIVAYFQLGRLEKAKEYEIMCIRAHGYDACATQQEKVILHDAYKQFERKQ